MRGFDPAVAGRSAAPVITPFAAPIVTDFAAFVTQIAQLQRRLVTLASQYDHRSRCPGEVPSSPWRLTGSGGVKPLDIQSTARVPTDRAAPPVSGTPASDTLSGYGPAESPAPQHESNAVLRHDRAARRHRPHRHHLSVRPQLAARPAHRLCGSRRHRQRARPEPRARRGSPHDRGRRVRARHRSQRLGDADHQERSRDPIPGRVSRSTTSPTSWSRPSQRDSPAGSTSATPTAIRGSASASRFAATTPSISRRSRSTRPSARCDCWPRR